MSLPECRSHAPEPVQGACEQCGDRGPLRRLDLAGAEYWLCAECRADWREAKRLGLP